jgi:hypothetical protein
MATPYYSNYYGSNEPQDIYGEQTSKEGNWVVAERKTGVYTAGAGRDGLQRRTKVFNVYKWQPKQQQQAAETESKTTEEAPTKTDPVINNPYADQIDNRTASKPTAKDFITRFGGNTETMAHSGLAAVRKAEDAGYSIGQIQQMGIDQGISFGSGAQTYFNQQRQKSFDDQLAAIQRQSAANLKQLTIDQNTRLDKMAADQQRRSDELATGQRTYQQNEARASQMGALQIAGSSETPRTGGTQGFKRRKLQINPVTANALAGILGGAAGSKTTNALNV